MVFGRHSRVRIDTQSGQGQSEGAKRDRVGSDQTKGESKPLVRGGLSVLLDKVLVNGVRRSAP
jgi:hypothetical protein